MVAIILAGALFAGVVALSGCTLQTSQEDMAATTLACPNCTTESRYSRAVKVGKVTGGASTGFDLKVVVSDEELRYALRDSLETNDLLADSGSENGFVLHMHVISIVGPEWGWGMTADTSTRYIMQEEESGHIVLDETIDTSESLSLSDEILGVERARLTVEGAIKKSITLLISRLYERKAAISMTSADRLRAV